MNPHLKNPPPLSQLYSQKYQYELHKKQLLKIYENKSSNFIKKSQPPQNNEFQNRIYKTNSFLNKMQTKHSQISRENVKLLGKLESVRPSVSRSLSENIDSKKNNRKIHLNPFVKQKTIQTEKQNDRVSFKMKNMRSSLNKKNFAKDYAKSQQIKNRLRRYESMQNRVILKSQRFLPQKLTQNESQSCWNLNSWRSYSTHTKFQMDYKIVPILFQKQTKFYQKQQILNNKIDRATNSLAEIRAKFRVQESKKHFENDDSTEKECFFLTTQYQDKDKKIIYVD